MGKQQLLEQVGTLLERIRKVKLIVPGDTGMLTLDDALVGQVRETLDSAIEVMADLIEHYDSEESSLEDTSTRAASDTDFLREIGAQISSKMAAQEISSLAFVSRSQLLELRDSLAHAVSERQIWKVASDTDTARRRVGRALVALEASICEYEGLPLRHRYWQGIDDALSARRLYGELRRAVSALAEPRGRQMLSEAFQKVANHIAKMRQLEIYPLLRIDDRLQLRRLQKRLLEWLEEDGETRDGERLWGDLESFSQLLSQINQRQELREHDREMITFLFERFLEREPDAEAINLDHLTHLKPLLGRDDALDTILLAPERYRVRDLRKPLERLRQELDKPFEAGPVTMPPGLVDTTADLG